MKVKSESEVTQSCPTPTMDCSLPGSSVHGICQARVLEWVVIAFSKERLMKLNKNMSQGNLVTREDKVAPPAGPDRSVPTLTLDPGHGLGHSNNPTWRQGLRLAGSEAERIGCDESLEVAPATAKPCGGGSGGGTTMTEAKAAQQETGGNE